MYTPSTSKDAIEDIVLLEDPTEERCCCGRYRLNGPDSAWSWIVAFANFLINFLMCGLGRISGILYIEFMNTFEIDRRTSSLPFSIQQATRYLFGPLAGLLGQKYGVRNVTVSGGIIASISTSFIFFYTDMTSITIIWGLFFGFSAALTTTLNQVSIDQYFKQNRTTAGGFAFSGGCIGAFFFPVVIETVIFQYNLRDAFLLIGAILLCVIPAALLLEEPPWQQNDDDGSCKQNTVYYGSFDVTGPKGTVNCRSAVPKSEIKKLPESQNDIRIDFVILRENSDIVFQLLTKEISNGSSETNQNNPEEFEKTELLNELEHIYSSFENPGMQPDSLSESSVQHENTKSEKECVVEVHVDAEINIEDLSIKYLSEAERIIYIQTKLHKLFEKSRSQVISHFPYNDQPLVCKIVPELQKLYEKLTKKPYIRTSYNIAQYIHTPRNKEVSHSRIKENLVNPDSKKHSNSFYSHIKTAVKLHANPLFLLICLSRVAFTLTFIPVLTIIVDFAMDQGLDKSQGYFAIAALSLGDFLGRLCLGWVTDRGYLSLPQYMLIVMILLGGNTAALPFLNSEIPLLAAVLTFGVLQGSLYIRHPMLISQYMKSHEQSIGMGFKNFFSGLVGFIQPVFIGYFRDYRGSYEEMFYLNGIVSTAVGLAWGLELYFSPSLAETENSKKKLNRCS